MKILTFAPPLPLEKIPANLPRLNATRIIRSGAVDQIADQTI
jgi:hypothetical protein